MNKYKIPFSFITALLLIGFRLSSVTIESDTRIDDLEKMGLNGKVKSVKSLNYKPIKISNLDQISDSAEGKIESISFFNSSGIKTEFQYRFKNKLPKGDNIQYRKLK